LIFQYRISRKAYPTIGSDKINKVRLGLLTAAGINFVLTFGFIGPAQLKFKGDLPQKWTKSDGGYGMHIASTVTEWICTMCVIIFLVTYWYEFRTFSIQEPIILLSKEPKPIISNNKLDYTVRSISSSVGNADNDDNNNNNNHDGRANTTTTSQVFAEISA